MVGSACTPPFIAAGLRLASLNPIIINLLFFTLHVSYYLMYFCTVLCFASCSMFSLLCFTVHWCLNFPVSVSYPHPHPIALRLLFVTPHTCPLFTSLSMYICACPCLVSSVGHCGCYYRCFLLWLSLCCSMPYLL